MRSIEGRGADFALHPLIYSRLEFAITQDIGRGKGNDARNKKK